MLWKNWMSELAAFKCGYIAIVGRPNVGKSTLLNQLLKIHLSITSKKPQTTRHQILGIKTTKTYQAIYVDTPGLHQGFKGEIHRYMNRQATTVLADVDVIVMVVEALRWHPEDDFVLSLLQRQKQTPVILVVNKIDLLKKKEGLLPYLEQVSEKYAFYKIIPLSAAKGIQTQILEQTIVTQLAENEAFYDPEQLTDRSERFLAAELIREQLMRLLGQELPYATAVEVEAFEEHAKIIKISALIWVERDNQKGIIVGEKGLQLKTIGTQARLAMQRIFAKKVLLKLWVKVKRGWSEDASALKSLGYSD